jgi:hypothetical protein
VPSQRGRYRSCVLSSVVIIIAINIAPTSSFFYLVSSVDDSDDLAVIGHYRRNVKTVTVTMA